jgi:hypothetical protein
MFIFQVMKMSTPIPIEQLKNIWRSFSELNAQIKELNEKLLSLKDYIDATLSRIDLSNYLTNDKVFKEGNVNKNIEIDKGYVFDSGNLEKSSIYLGGSYKGGQSYKERNIVIGYGAYSKMAYSIVLGTQAFAEGYQTVTIGDSASTTEVFSVAIGDHSSADLRGVAIGNMTKALGDKSAAIDYYANSSGASSIAWGNTAKALNTSCIAIGPNSKTTSTFSIAIGLIAQTSGSNGIAIGSSSGVGSSNSIAIGNCAKANYTNSITIGYNITATAANSIRIGNSSIVKAQFGDLEITWTTSSITFNIGENSATLTLSSPS